jgi:pantetheine-phosphate adenylyltransferase
MATQGGVALAKTMPHRVLFPGSFDPMTLGHLDVARRASVLFDEVIIAVGESRDKTPLFATDERLELIRDVCSDLDNLTVKSFSGLVVDFAVKEGVVAIVRGLRSSADYTYELQMALMNRVLEEKIETVFIPTSPEYAHISSSLTKEIAKHHGDLSKLVPLIVSQKLTERMK